MPKSESAYLPGKFKKRVEQIYKEHKRLMFFIAFKIVGNADHAEDIVQSSFLRIIKHIEKIDSFSPYEIKGYIIFIVKNLSLDFINKHENNINVPLDIFEEHLAGAQNETERSAILNLEITRVIECLDEIDPKYAFAVFHKYVLGYSMAEIAKMLGITVENAKVRCHRGRAKLVKMVLEGESNE